MIQQHQLRAIKSSNDEDVQRINIRRSQVYSDALQHFSKKAFDVEKLLKACFVRQEAVDLGILFHDGMAVANDTYCILLEKYFQHFQLTGVWRSLTEIL